MTIGHQKVKAFYYGWVIVGIAALSHFFSGPGQTYSNAIFIDYYINDFGWSRSAVSGIYSVATLLAGFMLFFIGRLVDNLGARNMAVIVSLLLAISCFFNSIVLNMTMLFIGFFFVRLFGQGAMTLVPNSLVPQWFIQKRGRALSIAALGGLIGSAIYPLLNVWLIDAFGWRITWQILGATIIVIFSPIAFFFIKNKPENIGLQPDNTSNETLRESHRLPDDVSWTVNEAMKTRVFWLLLICVAIPALVNTGLTFHLLAIFSEKSLSPEVAASVLSLMALIGLPATLFTGFLLDKFPVRLILAGMFAGEILTIFLLNQASSLQTAILFGVFWGFMVGIERIAISIVWPNYFGRRYLGSINGISMATIVIGSALGPLPFGLAYDYFGDFEEVIWVIMFFPLIGIIAAILSVPPKKLSQI
ncbi:MFS transporter [Virgibacillus soli]|nr:MFS transporter [Virgibacillus soli]